MVHYRLKDLEHWKHQQRKSRHRCYLQIDRHVAQTRRLHQLPEYPSARIPGYCKTVASRQRHILGLAVLHTYQIATDAENGNHLTSHDWKSPQEWASLNINPADILAPDSNGWQNRGTSNISIILLLSASHPGSRLTIHL